MCFTVKFNEIELYQGGDKVKAIQIAGIVTTVLANLRAGGKVVVLDGDQIVFDEYWWNGQKVK